MCFKNWARELEDGSSLESAWSDVESEVLGYLLDDAELLQRDTVS